MSVDLRPPLLDEVGLVPALRAYLEDQSSLSGVAMELEAGRDAPCTGGRLPSDLEIACFRVVQESITNALRHASARRVTRAHRAAAPPPSRCRSGTTAAASTSRHARCGRRRGHLGVVGMRERVRARGGTFQVTSTPGMGTTVTVDFPFEPA